MKGIDDLWILGDDFRFNSFNKQNLQIDAEAEEHYMKEHFEISGFNNDKSQSYDSHTLSHMRNNLVVAIRDQITFPK